MALAPSWPILGWARTPVAPVGGALLGLSVGDQLAWPGPGGKAMTVRVTEVIYQPERAGEMHR